MGGYLLSLGLELVCVRERERVGDVRILRQVYLEACEPEVSDKVEMSDWMETLRRDVEESKV